MTKWNPKCRFFNEKYACDTLSTEGYKSCTECKFVSPYSKKILIIKLGALGDVLRTTPILEAIKKKYGDETTIYWLTLENSKELLKNNPYINKILIYNPENILRIQQEEFDILYSLEITTPATILSNIVNAKEKHGYYFNNGATSCYNKGAEEYLETAFLTHIKLSNRKSYQELIFQACDLSFNKEQIIFELSEKEKKFAEEFKQKNNLLDSDKLIGINFSAGERWPTKEWSTSKLKELIKTLSKDYKIILLGGPEEREKIPQIISELKKEGIYVLSNNPENSIWEFASILDLCEKVIVTDSLSLHLSLALKKPTISLFFSTPPWEIEDYGNSKKIVSPLLEKHFFSMKYSDELANSISVEEVQQNVRNY
ncbi:MAG: glycosyltransferase family 9 protein [archaeon]